MSVFSEETQKNRPNSISSLGLSSSSSFFGSESSSQHQPTTESLKSSKIELIESYEQRFLNSLKQLNAPHWVSASSLKAHFKERETNSHSSTKVKYDRIRHRIKCGHSPSPLVSKSLNNSRSHCLYDDEDSKKSNFSEYGSKSAHSLSYSPALHRLEYHTLQNKRSVMNPRDSYLKPMSKSISALNSISPGWYKPKCLPLPNSEKPNTIKDQIEQGLSFFIYLSKIYYDKNLLYEIY